MLSLLNWPHIIACMAVSAAFAAISAMCLWRDVSMDRRSVDLLGQLLLFLGVQSLHVMVAGVCGALTGECMALTSGVGFAVLLAVPASRRRVVACFRELLVPSCRVILHGFARRPVLALIALAVSFFIVIHALMFVVLAPPLTFDALTYHLSKVAQWVHTGSIYLPDLPIKRVFWPGGMELLNAWWAVFPHHEILIETPGLFFHALAIGAVWVVARNMGVSRHAAGWSALLFAVTPAIVVHGTTCLTDLPTAALFLYLLAIWTSPAVNDASAVRRLFITVAAGCFALGIKPTIAFMTPGLAVAAIPAMGKRDLRALKSIFHASRTIWAVVLSAAFLGGYWYVRNAFRFGNPLYPVVVGTNTVDGIQSGSFSFSSLRTALSMLVVQGGILDGKPIIANLFSMAGWGWTAVCCGIPCSFFLACQSPKFRWLFIGQLVAMCTVLAMVLPDFSCLRFLLWLPAILCVGIVGAIALGNLPRPIVWCFIALAAWTAFLNLGSGLTNATGISWRKQWTAIGKRTGQNWAIQARFAAFVPDDEDIAVFMYKEGPLYLLYGPGFSRGVFTIEAADKPHDFAKILDDAGLRFLYFDDFLNHFPQARESLMEQLEAGLMTDLRLGLYIRGSEIPEEKGRR